MQLELNERKKLSQENEQLHWKIRQSFVSSALDGSALSARWVVLGIRLKLHTYYIGIFYGQSVVLHL